MSKVVFLKNANKAHMVKVTTGIADDSYIEIKSGMAGDGRLTAWEFHNYHSGASGIETPYTVENHRTEYHEVPLILRSGSYRGLEISDEVMEGPRSLVFPEAENRLHFQKGLVAVLMAGE